MVSPTRKIRGKPTTANRKQSLPTAELFQAHTTRKFSEKCKTVFEIFEFFQEKLIITHDRILRRFFSPETPRSIYILRDRCF